MSTERSELLFGMEAQKGRWLFVAAGFLINICLGSVYAYSVFRNPVQELFNTTSFESGLPFMIFLATFAILMFFGGRLIGTIGPRKVGIIGGSLVGAGWILSGILPQAVPSIWSLVLTYGVLGGAGVGLSYGGPLAVATRWFPDKKGLAVGLTIAGFGGSPFVTANLARPLIAANGPLTTFLIMGIAFLVIVILLSALLRFPSADWRPAGVSAGASAIKRVEIDTHTMVRTSTFWGLFLAYTIGCLAGLMAIGISSPVATEVIGIDAGTAAMLVGVFAIFNGSGRPLFGALTDRLTPRRAATLSMLVIAAASLFMVRASEGSVAIYVLCFAVLWLCLGGWLAIAPTSTATFFGTKNYARNYGVVFFAYGLGAILANIISGQSVDLFGSYNTAFMIVAGLAVVGAILSFTLLKPPAEA
ncbi:MAG: OFA family MFS transporter [Chloroflexota bacterium]